MNHDGIDNQLRGRSGRQGDRCIEFYLSLEDDLMRIFGSERLDSMLQKMGLREGEAIIHPWINKAIEKAQSKVEARNFEIRKQLLKYDDVMNDQRRVIFEQRKEIMNAESVAIRSLICGMRWPPIWWPPRCLRAPIPISGTDELKEGAMRYHGLDIPADEWCREDGMDQQAITED